jgi:hypothetical protein
MLFNTISFVVYRGLLANTLLEPSYFNYGASSPLPFSGLVNALGGSFSPPVLDNDSWLSSTPMGSR